MRLAVAKAKDGFGQKLKQLRLARGMRSIKLARASGVSKQSISDYERGVRSPTWDAVVKLADALGVSLDAFRDDD